MQSFVIKTPHHNILIDSCVGNHKPRPSWPFWNMMNSDRFEKSLAAAGLTANEIDYVMCTHLHVDHVGWNTRLENGRWVPTFPKAKYVMADRELAYWTQKEKDDPSGVPWITDSVLPIVEAERAQIVKSDGQLAALERRTTATRDKIDHPRGARDDVANAAAGALVAAADRRNEVKVIGGWGVVTAADLKGLSPVENWTASRGYSDTRPG